FLSSCMPATQNYTLSLHDALPIWGSDLLRASAGVGARDFECGGGGAVVSHARQVEGRPLRGESPGLRPGLAGCIHSRPYGAGSLDRKSTRLNSSHQIISYAVFCLK